MPHLVIDITAHGLGHLAQTSSVVAALRRRRPDLRLTLRTGHGAATLARFIDPPWDLAPPPPDLGMAMLDANRVDVAASHRYYADLHRDWGSVVATQSSALTALKPDLLLSNIAYTGLAGAQAAGIPCLAACSLNWHDVAAAYLSGLPGMDAALAQMHAAYAGARAFIRLEPALPMDSLPNRVAVSPVARLGTDRRTDLDRLFPQPPRHLVVVSFGGIAGPPILTRVPRLDGVAWLLNDPQSLPPGRDDVRLVDEVPVPFQDMVRSADLALTKPGYGMFADSICNGTRLLSLTRPDWPETPWLTGWAKAHGVAGEIDTSALNTPALDALLLDMLARPIPPPPPARGGEEAAAIVLDFLGEGRV